MTVLFVSGRSKLRGQDEVGGCVQKHVQSELSVAAGKKYELTEIVKWLQELC